MKMIIGGAFQGKLAYAKNKYPDTAWTDGEQCQFEEIYTCVGINHFHHYIRRALKAGRDMDTLAAEIISRNPEIIIISDEIGYGLVPIEKFERSYREQTGRICTELAGYSKRVDRVICGIGNAIKEVEK